ncbi:MAG: hypothetical protein KTR31_24690 [Myxococcales bacterium]|nr:hypothetical protein [Myxococcales bacterium]
MNQIVAVSFGLLCAVGCSGDDKDRTSTLTDTAADTDVDADTDTDTDTDADVDTSTGGTGDTAQTSGDVTIFDVQAGAVAEGTEVQVQGVVTGIAADGVFLQDPQGGPRSGLWVFLGKGWDLTWGPAARGDRAQVLGTYQEYFGQTQIDASGKSGVDFAVLGTDTEPAPTVVDVAALAKDPEAWEGVLVTLEGLTVSVPDAGAGDFEVTDRNDATWLVGDRCYAYLDDVTLDVSDGFEQITGVWDYVFTAYQLQPRNQADLVATPTPTGDTGSAGTADTGSPGPHTGLVGSGDTGTPKGGGSTGSDTATGDTAATSP